MERRTSFHGREQYSGESDNDKMNSWKGEQTSPADTYIEWCFEQKCKQLSNGFGIITEWRTRKQQYIQITGTTIFDFQHYSRHDATHSIAILETIELLLGKNRVDLLSAGDLWLLLEVAYSHDAGMAMNYDEVLTLWDEDEEFQEFIRECIEEDFGDVSKAALYYKEADNLLRNRSKMENLQDYEEIFFERDWPVLSQKYILILVTEYIRKKHAGRVMRIFDEVDCSRESIIPPRLYRVAAMVCQMHGKSFCDIFQDLKYYTKGFGSGAIHPQFAAAMLRIGDLLDIDNNRFSPYAIAHFGRLPLASLLHLKKHKAITDIGITEAEINAEAHTDEYEVGLLTNDWFRMIDEEVGNLICNWNVIVPEMLIGCTLQQSHCCVYLLGKDGTTYQAFNAGMQREFTINKKKLINLLIGTSIYDGDMDFLREYIQNAMDASKMQLWMDLESGKYEYLRNSQIVELQDLTPFDLDSSVYNTYGIQISVEWNRKNDKIRLKIKDQGIGIEKGYLNCLSNIGTGWKGRKGYKNELKKMIKWLQPTGGFGIGIQSAFMIVDTVEIFTKSERDSNGYKIILKSPDKMGSISTEEISGLRNRGTTVILEIEPEKFQDWARYMNKHNIKRESSSCVENEMQFDREKWDEFNLDAVLSHAQNVIFQYVKDIVPNPLFPIEVVCPVMKSMMYSNTYMEKVDYWKKNSSQECISTEISNGTENFRCIFIPKDTEGKQIAVIWEQRDCIFLKVELKPQRNRMEQRICFKNVLVRSADAEKMDIFQRFGIFIDFMGFRAEKCLRIHRNCFSEKFHWEKYYREGFGMLIRFLKSEEKKTEDVGKVLWLYEMQLICLLEFFELYDGETASNMHGQSSAIQFDFEIDENKKLKVDLKENMKQNREVLWYLSSFYQTMGTYSGGILLALQSDRDYPLGQDKLPFVKINPNYIIEWVSAGDTKPDVKKFLDLTKEGIGAIKDPFTVKSLLCDERLDKKAFWLPEEKDYYFLLLFEKKKSEEMSLKEIHRYFWDDFRNESAIKGRRYALCTGNNKYDCLLVDARPYQNEETKKGESFLLSPISNTAYQNVIAYKSLGKKMDYNVFRIIVWGRKGHESPDYKMLIDWVIKHQLEDRHAGREEIMDAYEELLKDIYLECVCDT